MSINLIIKLAIDIVFFGTLWFGDSNKKWLAGSIEQWINERIVIFMNITKTVKIVGKVFMIIADAIAVGQMIIKK